jgi:hypothetical protein
MVSVLGRTLQRKCDQAERVERRKIENRESDGALDFDGFCWMGGRNNQPKVSLHVRIWLGSMARWMIRLGWVVIPLFGPSN